MRLKKVRQYLFLIIGFSLTVLVFQNCNKSNFSEIDPASIVGEIIITTEDGSTPITPPITPPITTCIPTELPPDPNASSGQFNDVSGTRGQQWVDSNEIVIAGLSGPTEMTVSSNWGNTAYTLNSVRVSLAVDKCSHFFTAKFIVRNGDRLGLHKVNLAWGNYRIYATSYLNGVKYNWNITSFDYTKSGGKNCRPSQAGRCTGNIIGTISNGGDYSSHFLGGCLDQAQDSQIIKCVEKPSNGVGDCTMYDGPVDIQATMRPGLHGIDCSKNLEFSIF